MKLKKYLLFIALLSWMDSKEQAASISGIIAGKIISNNDQTSVEGASISTLHGRTTSVSGNDGSFSIRILSFPDTLIISHISYKSRRIALSTESEPFQIIKLDKLEKELADVQVIVNNGFQKLPRERTTGSFTLINNSLYNEQVGSDAFSRLAYISNGVTTFPQTVSRSNSFLIRGLSTLTIAIARPLIILDNFPYQGDINNINPNDVENISFLKDAAASSIWGAQTGNGVLVVTTKKGHFNERTNVEINSNITFSDEPDLFCVKNISASDFIDAEQFLFNNGFFNNNLMFPKYVVSSPVVHILDDQRNGLISSGQASSAINALRNIDVRNQFKQYFYQRPFNQQYAASVSGGGNNHAWILSAGFDKNLNELAAEYNRVSIRLDNTYNLTKQLSINTSVYFIDSKSYSGKPGYGDVRTSSGSLPPYTQLVDLNGQALPLYTTYDQKYIDTVGGGKLQDWKYYPLTDYKYTQNTNTVQDLNAVIGLDYRILSSLNLNIKYRYEKQQSENRILNDVRSYFARNLINNYSQINPATGAVKYIIPKGAILELADHNITAQNIRVQLNFNKTWSRQEVVLLAGSEIGQNISQGNNKSAYGYNDDILTSTQVDYANVYPLITGGGNFIPYLLTGFSKTNNRFVSFFANGAYTYRGRYSVSASARRDASNLFGFNTNDKWKPLWSAGFSWEINKELFYHLQLLPYLKLRFTYGHQGDIDPGKVAVTTIYYLGTNPYTRTPESQLDNYINPELRWEQVAMTNLGLDFGTKGRRLSGSIEYYQKNMTDLYGPSPIDITTGLGVPTIVRNVGSLSGHGFDIELNSINLPGRFGWATDFILNTYKEKVTRFNDPAAYFGGDVVGGGFSALQGYPPFAYFAFRWAGLDPATGDPQGYLGKTVSKDYASILGTGTKVSDLKYIGPLLPTVFGSVGNTFSYKGFSLAVRIVYKLGYYFRRPSINYYTLASQDLGHPDYALRWQKPGDEKNTDVPSFTYPLDNARDNFYQYSTPLATRGDQIRLQYVNLSYDFKKGSLKKLSFMTSQIYLVLNNLGILWKANKYGIDPDYNNSIPIAKSIAVGLRIGI